MKHTRTCLIACGVILQLFVSIQAASALGPVSAGPYSVTLITRPAVIPVGKADLVFTISGKDGSPVKDAAVRAIAQMPGMPMGEREQVAVPGDEPGVYVAPAVFPMAGDYEVVLQIAGSAGTAKGTMHVKTGQDTSESGGGLPLGWIALAAVIVILAGFVVSRMRATGQRFVWKAVFTRTVIIELLLLALAVIVAVVAVRHFRREGAMTPIEAQAMEMNTPAPPGVTPVTLAKVERRTISSAVRYTGQAAGFVEQDVTARVTGVITWMPYYAGDRVKTGQLLAKLDTTQSDPELRGREAAAEVAFQGVGVARGELDQAMRAVERAHAESAGASAAVEEARANLTAARQERATSSEAVISAKAGVEDAEAQVSAARADQQYWRGQIQRTAELLKAGAVSGEEYKREKAQADGAEAKVRQAEAQALRARAGVRTAESGLRASEAGVKAAQAKLEQAATQERVHHAHVGEESAGVEVARRKLAQAQAGAAEGRASVSSAAAARGYSRIVAQADGVIMQRLISPGALVEPGQAILRVAQISPIRLQANVAEADIARIELGASVLAHSPGGESVEAHVTSIFPAVDPRSRTAIVEAVLANKDQAFLPGSYVVMNISTGRSRSALSVPTRALEYDSEVAGSQKKEQAAWVWLAKAEPDGSLSAHRTKVTTGITNGEYTEILSGLADGQRVVVEGQDNLQEGQALEAETGRTEPEVRVSDGVQTARVEVLSGGYKPSSLTLTPGAPAKLTFVRTSDVGCGTELLIPAYGVKKSLPLNKPVTVEITPRKGEYEFTCGMNMLKGKLVVK